MPVSGELVAGADRVSGVEGLPVGVRVVPDVVKGDGDGGGVDVTLVEGESVPVGVESVVLRVESFEAETVAELGGEVLVFGVTPPADVVAKGGVLVEVTVDYSEYRWVLGGDWSQRLQLVEWACDPRVVRVAVKECGNPVPVVGVVNDFEAGTLTATVRLGGQGEGAPAGASRAGVFAGDGSTLGLASAAGSFEATSLSNSGSWQVGGNNGSFSYSYPVVTPPAFNGLGPSVALSYDSSGADGITSDVNSQAGEVGLGWNLNAGQGFIERRYLPCTDSRIGGGTSDSCWYVQNATISLNGHASELVPINGSVASGQNSFTQWRLKDDPDWLVERVTSGSDWWVNEHWKVITPEGMVYWFGREDEGQESRLVRPLRGLNSGDPCYSRTNKLCVTAGTADMPYRWLLDKVEDPFGNVMVYKYEVTQNRARTLGSGYSAVYYDMNAVLKEILYGKSPNAGINGYRSRVEFTYVRRCTGQIWTAQDGSCPTVSNANGTSYPDVPTDLYCPSGNCFKDVSFFSIKRLAVITTQTSPDGSAWTNVNQWRLYHSFPDPADGGNEKMWFHAIYRVVPSSTVPVTATVLDLGTEFGGTALQNRHDANPGAGVPYMKQFRVNRITDALGQEVTVTYSAPTGTPTCSSSTNWSTNTTNCYPMYASFTGGGAGWGRYLRYRVDSVSVRDLVTNPYGATGNALTPIVTYAYEYTGAAWHHDGNDWWVDTPGVDDVSWGQWRGYREVKTTVGSGSTKTVTIQRFFQGMHGDKAGGGGTKTVTLTKSWTTTSEGTTGTINDEDWLQGQVFESFQMDGTGGTIAGGGYLSASRNESTWTLESTDGTQVKTGLATKQSRKWRITLTYSRLRDGAPGSYTWRDSRTDTSVDSSGRPVVVNSTGFLDASGDESCSRTWYINASTTPSVTSPGWMNLVAQSASYATLGNQPTHPMSGASPVAGSCTSQPISVSKTFYSTNQYASGSVANIAVTQTLGAGFKPVPITTMSRLKNWNGQTDDLDRWAHTHQAFDAAGRITSVTDANGNTTTFEFDSTYGYSNEATYPIGSMTTSTVLRPGDGLPQQTTDQNGLHTYYCYDSLSRLTAVYAPIQTGNRGHTDPCSTYVNFTSTAGEVPTAKFGYYVGSYVNNATRQAKQPAVVWSSIWQTGDTAATDVRVETAAYIDGNGRTRETQTFSPTTGKIIVTAAVTDDRGNTAVTVDPFAITDNLDTNGYGKPGDRTSPPSLTGASEGFATWPSWPASTSVKLRTTTPVYDTANRVTSTTVAWDGTTLVTSNTEYRGTTTITKPQIGSWQSTTVDGLGRTMNVKTYNGTTAPDAGTLYGTDAITTYTYSYNQTANDIANTLTESGWLTTTITDDATNTTTIVTDLQGRTIRSTDPNAGLSTFTYDSNGNITKVVDAVPNTVNTTYDAMNRPTYRWSGTAVVDRTQMASEWAAMDAELKLAEWTYDNSTAGEFGLGMPKSETSWQNGIAYTSEVVAYTGRYQPVETRANIPAGSPMPSHLEGNWDFEATYNEGGQQLTTTSDNYPNGTAYTLTTHFNGYAMADQLAGSDGSFVTGTSFDDLGRVTNRILARNTSYASQAALVREYGYHTPTGMLDTIKAGWDTTPTSTGDVTWWQHDRYTRDAVGNVKVIEDLGLEAGGSGSNIKECFVYDNWNRLIRAHTAPETTSGYELVGCATTKDTSISDRATTDPYDTVWTFDDINRMGTRTDTITTDVTTWGYTGTKHAPTSLTGATTGTYTYNQVGGMATRNGDTLTYDTQQRLTNYNTSGVDDEYVYTTTNQRLIRKHGDVVTLYLGGMEVTWDGTTSTVTRYPTIGGTTVATHTTILGGGGTPTVTWNCGNMQNTTVCQAPTATNANPAVPARKRYTPYGEDRGTTTFTNTDHGFLGQPEDTTGLTYLNNRYHDPHLAAFTSVDPLVGQTGTPYLYGHGNPTTLSDPSGLAPCEDDGNCPWSGRPTGPSAGSGGPGTNGTTQDGKFVRSVTTADFNALSPEDRWWAAFYAHDYYKTCKTSWGFCNDLLSHEVGSTAHIVLLMAMDQIRLETRTGALEWIPNPSDPGKYYAVESWEFNELELVAELPGMLTGGGGNGMGGVPQDWIQIPPMSQTPLGQEWAKKLAGRPPGSDYELHHIVSQNVGNITKYGLYAVHEEGNTVWLPHDEHTSITAWQNSPSGIPGVTMNDYMTTLSWGDQDATGRWLLDTKTSVGRTT
ncbi:MAG TPA: hypothetical protein DCR14_05065 [Acidimicrobiaceae bacterium]|nr:hypothetical protein [Acidimicrobiaceae bacterium]